MQGVFGRIYRGCRYLHDQEEKHGLRLKKIKEQDSICIPNPKKTEKRRHKGFKREAEY